MKQVNVHYLYLFIPPTPVFMLFFSSPVALFLAVLLDPGALALECQNSHMYKWKKQDNYNLTVNQILDFKSVCVFSAYEKYEYQTGL